MARLALAEPRCRDERREPAGRNIESYPGTHWLVNLGGRIDLGARSRLDVFVTENILSQLSTTDFALYFASRCVLEGGGTLQSPPMTRPDAAILALDQGTTGSTALVFGPEGEVLGRAYAEIPQHYPQPGWVEHDAEEIWQKSRRVMAEAVAAAGVAARAIRAIGITNQRETTVLWDRRTGDPVHRAIVWQSRQTAPVCERLRAAGHEPLFHERTGLVLDPYFSGSKIAGCSRATRPCARAPRPARSRSARSTRG